MKLTAENKAYIDKLSYEQLLERWRCTPIGDPWFEGETGIYWSERMTELSEQTTELRGNDQQVAASKTNRGRGLDPTNILFSVDTFDRGGDLHETGIYLHFGETRIRVANSIDGFAAVADRIYSMVDEIRENYPDIDV